MFLIVDSSKIIKTFFIELLGHIFEMSTKKNYNWKQTKYKLFIQYDMTSKNSWNKKKSTKQTITNNNNNNKKKTIAVEQKLNMLF